MNKIKLRTKAQTDGKIRTNHNVIRRKINPSETFANIFILINVKKF